MTDDEPQLPLPELAKSRARAAKPPEPVSKKVAEVDPVARVLVDVPLMHLDRPFDYAVPAKDAQTAVPGARVKVRFAGQDVDGYVLERATESDHRGRLQPLRRVVSPEPVLHPEIARLTDLVARRYAGTRADVLRLAVPPRHATQEKQPRPDPPAGRLSGAESSVWAGYEAGADLLDALAGGRSPRAVWAALPGADWTTPLVEAVLATAASGRGVVVCVPDRRDVERLDAALLARAGTGHHVVLTADLGPARRYAAFLAASRGDVRIVIGTRAAAFASVADLGLVAIWDDGDDLFEEPRAPYPHAREVLLLRAQDTGCAALVGGYARSAEAQYLLRTGWARELAPARTTVRESISVTVTGDSHHDLDRDPYTQVARLPGEVFTLLRGALEHGPVLVQTPRAGHSLRLACARCRTPAECAHCHGPLQVVEPARGPECAWCLQPAPDWSCPECGARGLRAPVVGERRTAEELGRAFPQVAVRRSAAGQVLPTVPERPALVIATPGAEPVAEGGYAAVVLLDTWLLLSRPDLRVGEESVRRWANAAALARPAPDGGRVLAVGDSVNPHLQALVRWDPAGHAEREITERVSAHLPPAAVVVSLTGEPDDLAAAQAGLELPRECEVLGPVPADEDRVRLLLRAPRASRAAVVDEVRRLQAARSTRKLPHLRVQVDPRDLG